MSRATCHDCGEPAAVGLSRCAAHAELHRIERDADVQTAALARILRRVERIRADLEHLADPVALGQARDAIRALVPYRRGVDDPAVGVEIMSARRRPG